jgi:hypothetical protein
VTHRILVINRFENENGHYHKHIDHRENTVVYITTKAGSDVLDHDAAAEMVIVEDLTDRKVVRAHARTLSERHGPFTHLLALSEFDLDFGADLREELAIPGPTRADVRRVRDKIVMKERVTSHGLQAPRYILATTADEVRAFAAEVSYPVVLKPRDGWDSQGIYVVASPSALADVLASQDLAGYECEEFIQGTMYHVDGIARRGNIEVLRASRLSVPCLDFALGKPFASVANDDAALEARIRSFTLQVVRALDMGTSAFHLELFKTDARGTGDLDDLIFLEIGGRVGGSQIPNIWREVYGVDLVGTWVRMLLGESPEMPPVGMNSPIAGYLMMPQPPVRPCRVDSARSQIDHIPEMYAEVLPAPGAVLNGTGGAKETAGHYRYRADDMQRLEAAIQATLDGYRLDVSPVEIDESQRRGAGRMQSAVYA